MRTKLFLAFLSVIFIALISNFIFRWLIIKDFEDYVRGTKEDQFYWVLASVEGSYLNGEWDRRSLADSIHWAMMLGFDVRIEDKDGVEIMSSEDVVDSLSPAMRRRMEALVHIHSAEGEFEPYPLYIEGKEVGTLYVRALSREGLIKEKELIFKKRGKDFLTISFLIAGGGALFLAVFFSLFLSRPIKRLKSAAAAVAKSDFSVRVKTRSKKDEIGKLSDSFNYMAEALQREEALRRHLTSNIAHELRTPLTVMKANVEAVIDGVIENRHEGLENIRGEVERLIKLVEGIEDFTKAEASFFSKGDYARVNLREFLDGIAYVMQPLFSEKGLELKVAGRSDINVITDTDKLDRIIKNIISNSLKYTEKGGVWVDYGTEGRGFFIEVRDSGAGIPAGELPMIFERFYRGENSSASGEGIGLGLAIVKELIDAMGGRVDVKSSVGEGTTFRVWLPFRDI